MASGALACVSLASCASGTEDFVTGDGPDGASSLAVDAMARSPGADSSGHVMTRIDASSDTDASLARDAALPGDDDDAEALDVRPAIDTGVSDANHTGSDSGGACDGLSEWLAGTTDVKVRHFGEKYTCLVPGWCSESSANGVAAYEPGKGWAWTTAWQDSGPCPTGGP